MSSPRVPPLWARTACSGDSRVLVSPWRAEAGAWRFDRGSVWYVTELHVEAAATVVGYVPVIAPLGEQVVLVTV